MSESYNPTIIRSYRITNQTSRLSGCDTHVETEGEKVDGEYESRHRIERQSAKEDEFEEEDECHQDVNRHDEDEWHEEFTLVFSQAINGEDGRDSASDGAAEQGHAHDHIDCVCMGYVNDIREYF